MLKHFERNECGRDLIVGDIHGHFTKLQAALDVVGFDPERGDRLFSVGDLVDRGPESDQATDWIEKPWFHAVQGNHEDFAIRWPNGHMQAGHYVANGGGWNVANPTAEQRRIADAFAALPVAIELETEGGLVGIVHADCPCRSWLAFSRALRTGWVETVTGELRCAPREVEHLVMMAMWSRDRADKLFDGDVQDVRAVVVGHTPMKRMTSLGNVVFIDTGGWLGREFTILDARTLQPAAEKSRLQWA